MSKTGIAKAKARQGRVHKKSYDAYKNSGRQDINKAKRLLRHLRKQPEDRRVIDVLFNLPLTAVKKAAGNVDLNELRQRLTQAAKEAVP